MTTQIIIIKIIMVKVIKTMGMMMTLMVMMKPLQSPSIHHLQDVHLQDRLPIIGDGFP